jgi:ribosomal protein S18 acetylase RimI-like enzyme
VTVSGRAAGDLEALFELWRAHDATLERAAPTRWGAVVADRRYPGLDEANYARVEVRTPVRLQEIDAEVARIAPSPCSHVVVFHPEDQTDLIAAAGTRGDRLLWDLVMVHRGSPVGGVGADRIRTEEVHRFDDAFWLAHAASARAFGIEDPVTIEQLQALERETMIPFGRRWFTVRDGGDAVAFAALLVVATTAYLDHVVTVPAARRRGYAEALTRRALAAASDVGVTSTFLLADPGGDAERIYRRAGFEPLGHLASWTRNRGDVS